MLVLAYTGVAAINVDGVTIDKVVYRNHGYSDMPPDTLANWLKVYPSICLLAFDEMSFVGHQDLVLCHLRFSQAYGSLENSPFAGVPTVLLGDFFQLPKVGCPFMLFQLPLSSYPAANPGDVAKRNRLLQGYKLYRLFTTAVELTQVLRQSGPLLSILERFRDQKTTQEDLDLLNSRVIGTATCPTPPGDISTITATMLNSTRTSINTPLNAMYNGLHQDPADPNSVLDDCKPVLLQGIFSRVQHRNQNRTGGSTGSTSVSRFEQDLLEQQTDDKFKGRPATLLLKPGTPLVVGENFYLGDKLVASNGSEGRLWGIHWHEDTQFTPFVNADGIVEYLVPDRQAIYLFLKLNGVEFNFQPYEGLPPGVIPIRPSRVTYKTTDTETTKNRVLCNFALSQFPVCPNFICANVTQIAGQHFGFFDRFRIFGHRRRVCERMAGHDDIHIAE